MRSMFELGVLGAKSPFNGTAGSIPVYNLTRETIDKDRSILKKYPRPPGTTVTYPYTIKIAGEGEYLVQSDGTAQFYSYKHNRWEPPQIVDNNSPWGEG